MQEPEKIQFEVELTESRRGVQTSLAAQVQFHVHGRKWSSVAVGLGADRKDAVADLINQKFPKVLGNAIAKHIAHMEEADPKVDEQPEVPATGCEDETNADQETPSSEAVVKPESASESTDQASSLTEKKGTQNKPSENSQKPAGTKPEPESQGKKLPF